MGIREEEEIEKAARGNHLKKPKAILDNEGLTDDDELANDTRDPSEEKESTKFRDIVQKPSEDRGIHRK